MWDRIEPWGSRHRLVAVFFSADEPPTEALLSLSRRWPGLLFENLWREGLMAEAGIWIAQGGEVVADARGSYEASQMTVGPFGDPLPGVALTAVSRRDGDSVNDSTTQVADLAVGATTAPHLASALAVKDAPLEIEPAAPSVRLDDTTV